MYEVQVFDGKTFKIKVNSINGDLNDTFDIEIKEKDNIAKIDA